MPEIDWEQLREKLPMEKTAEQKARRKEMFESFDPNGNGYCSLAEIDKGLDEVGLHEIFDCKPVVMRAYTAAKSIGSRRDGSGSADFIEFREFRLLLVYLRRYFELWQMFDDVDKGNDRRISLEEFTSVVPRFEEWGLKLEDPAAEFEAIDTNGGGQILFDEFSEWAIRKGLDLEDDDE